MRIESHGASWLGKVSEDMIVDIKRMSPSEFCEKHRYLPASVTPIPGPLRFDINPYMREIVDCFDVESPVREVNLKKGVQITYTTALECGIFYFAAHIRNLPMMFISADKELAHGRMERYVLPMLQHSGFSHIIRSGDIGNSRKTGKTKDLIEFEGDGFLVPQGAQNANKMRSYSIAVMLKDEIDGWPDTVGKDGEPDSITDDRCAAFWQDRKIFRGTTPLLKESSKIEKQFLRGDQRVYRVLCKSCNFPQHLRWETVNRENGLIGGFQWDYDDGVLIPSSVRYVCYKCGCEHYEHDKELLFSPGSGAHWHPTARPREEGIRSYHLPALYSPAGMQPWSKCASAYLEAYDPLNKQVRDPGKLQVFYNNVLGEAYEIRGGKVLFSSVSAHRRLSYKMGEAPNTYAKKHSGSPILFTVITIDVHKDFLAYAVFGVCKNSVMYLLEYEHMEGDDCGELTSPIWGQLRERIETNEYRADDGKVYKPALVLIDAGWRPDTVVSFCNDYTEQYVCPIIGRDKPAKNQSLFEFAPFKTKLGGVAYRVTVDYYKDRMATALRREWGEEQGEQREYHFNAPYDTTDKHLKELTVERRVYKIDDRGRKNTYWHRPGNARNELWDCLGYAYAAVEMIAYAVCIEQFKAEKVDWERFWGYIENEELYFEQK